MSRFLLCLILLVLAAPVYSQTGPPSITPNGVVSAADYTAAQAPNQPTRQNVLSGGSLITIFGQNLALGTSVATSLPLPTTLGGTSVFFQTYADGVRHPVPLLYVSPTQINAEAPAQRSAVSQTAFWGPRRDEYAGGGFVVQVGAQESASEFVLLHDSVPAGFTVPNTSRQLAYLVSARDGAAIAPTRGALPGEPVTLYLTGLGPARGGTPGVFQATENVFILVADGEAAPLTHPYPVWTTPTVTVGGRPAVVLFAGLAPGFVGLDQLNFVIPPDAPLGCNVPITITGDTYSTGPATVSISANAGPCQ